jgi:hypothetical protein
MRLQHALADARHALADAASPTHTELQEDSEQANTRAHAAACDVQPAGLQQQKSAGNTGGKGGGENEEKKEKKEKIKARAVVDPMFPVGKVGGVSAYEEAHCGAKEVPLI